MKEAACRPVGDAALLFGAAPATTHCAEPTPADDRHDNRHNAAAARKDPDEYRCNESVLMAARNPGENEEGGCADHDNAEGA